MLVVLVVLQQLAWADSVLLQSGEPSSVHHKFLLIAS